MAAMCIYTLHIYDSWNQHHNPHLIWEPPGRKNLEKTLVPGEHLAQPALNIIPLSFFSEGQ